MKTEIREEIMNAKTREELQNIIKKSLLGGIDNMAMTIAVLEDVVWSLMTANKE